jgi:hypothetical protein
LYWSHKWFWVGHGFTGCGKSRDEDGFWVEQRFSAALSPFVSWAALAAEVAASVEKDFFRSLFSRAAWNP